MINYKPFLANLLILLFIGFNSLWSQNDLSIISWNIENFGKTKDDNEIRQIATIVKEFDIVAIQEVVAIDPGGAQAVARLADQLNRMGSKWDYSISDPTNSPSRKTERYAFLWKTSQVTSIGRPWLASQYAREIFREPYLAKFRTKLGEIVVLNFHSRRFDENPDEEVPFLAKLIAEFGNTPIVVAGDFNLPSDHLIFQNFSRIGLYPTLTNQPTTLKRKCPSSGIDIYLNHPIDHIFFSKQFFRLAETGIVDFVRSCTRLTEARMISDHVPVWMQIGLKN